MEHKKGTGHGEYGNKKIGTPKHATDSPDASKVKEKTHGGKSAKSATMFKT